MIQIKQKLISAASPFPHISQEGIMEDGILIQQPSICRSCGRRVCVDSYFSASQRGFQDCLRGLSFYVADFGDFRFVINGLLITGHHSKQPRKQKKRLAAQSISETVIQEWVGKCRALTTDFEILVGDAIQTSLSMLHDVKTAVSLVFRNAESLINEEPGASFDEKVENATFNKKALFKAVGLLEERLKMMNLLSNPDAASHGQKRPTPVYKVIDKIAKLFYPIANQKRLRIILNGTSFNSPYLYESFSTIPLVLVDNAIKYSAQDQNVTIEVRDDGPSVRVKVESFSARIQRCEVGSIFEKEFRGSNSHLCASTGSGLGLYLADIVARANGFSVSHTEQGNPVQISGIEFVSNIFSFVVR